MQTDIDHSIQEYCKKINREISPVLLMSLGLWLVFLGILLGILHSEGKSIVTPVVYERGQIPVVGSDNGKSRPFASKNGKTFTYSWCARSSAIRDSNKVYFSSEKEALASGRTRSRLCDK